MDAPSGNANGTHQYEFGEYRLTPALVRLDRNGQAISLPPRAYETLLLLVENRDRVVSKQELLDRVWAGAAVEENNLSQSISALRKALGDTRREARFIHTVSRVGYRFAMPVTPVESRATSAPAALPARPHRIPRAYLAAAAACFLAALVGWVRWPHPPPGSSTVAVLPFENLGGDPSSEWLSTALAEILARQLSIEPGARVAAPETVHRAVRELAWKPGARSPAQLRRLRRNLGADLVVSGTYSLVGGRLQVRAAARTSSSGRILVEASETDSADQLFGVALRVGARLRGGWQPSAPPLEDTGLPRAVEPMRLYADGLDSLRRGDRIVARDFLERAAAADPSNALVFSALARALGELGYDDAARAAATRALDLSARLTSAERLEVEGHYRRAVGDKEGAVRVFRSLFAMFPDSLEDGLLLARAQLEAEHRQDAQLTLAALHRMSQPAGGDPTIDIQEALVYAASGDMERGRQLAHRAAERALATGARLVYARARLLESGILQNLGKDPTPARDEARRICEEVGDRSCLAAADRVDGNRSLYYRKFDEAERFYRRALDITRETGSRLELLNLLNGLGSLDLSRGDFPAAESRFEEALRLANEIHSPIGVVDMGLGLAKALQSQGRLGPAAALLQQSVATAKSTEDRVSRGEASASLAELLWWRGDTNSSIRAYEDASRDLRAAGKSDALSFCLIAAGRLHAAIHDPRRAQELLEEARKLDDSDARGDWLLASGELARLDGRPAEGLRYATDAVTEFQRTRRPGEEAEAWIERGAGLRKLGAGDQAETALRRAEALAAHWPDPRLRLRLALAWDQLRNDQRALGATIREARRLGYLALGREPTQ